MHIYSILKVEGTCSSHEKRKIIGYFKSYYKCLNKFLTYRNKFYNPVLYNARDYNIEGKYIGSFDFNINEITKWIKETNEVIQENPKDGMFNGFYLLELSSGHYHTGDFREIYFLLEHKVK